MENQVEDAIIVENEEAPLVQPVEEVELTHEEIMKKNEDLLAAIAPNDEFLHAVLVTLSPTTNLTNVTEVSGKLSGLVCAYTGMFSNDPFQYIQMMTDCCRNMQTTANRMAHQYILSQAQEKAAATPAE
jgi:hypothetical protein